MDNNNTNPSIGCSVMQCKYHSTNEGYCALDKIQVGAHEEDPTVEQCTDCESFEKK
jgi:Domain of Unknown Function (DUF1540).